MLWIVWALLLIGHGALSRWVERVRLAKTVGAYAKAALLGDVLLIAIGLITLDQLQGMGVSEVVRVGVFFVAFGGSGRQLMGSVLKSAAA